MDLRYTLLSRGLSGRPESGTIRVREGCRPGQRLRQGPPERSGRGDHGLLSQAANVQLADRWILDTILSRRLDCTRRDFQGRTGDFFRRRNPRPGYQHTRSESAGTDGAKVR